MNGRTPTMNQFLESFPDTITLADIFGCVELAMTIVIEGDA